jgi:acyl-CoA synthetase (AMP-forming)/AMP-acid ligase II
MAWGVPDKRSGERLVAYVVARAGEVVTEGEIGAYCGDPLVGYKCPGVVRIVEALPMTGVQKLDRVALRRMASWEEDGGQG